MRRPFPQGEEGAAAKLTASKDVESARTVVARFRSLAGFTLVEILIAVGVIAVLSGLILVNFTGVTRTERLRAAARKIAGMSDYVRSEAVSKKRFAYLDIDFDRNRYRFRMEPPRDEFGRFVDPDDPELLMSANEVETWSEVFAWETLPSGVYFRRLWRNHQSWFEKGTPEITYQANGTLNSWILWLQATAEEGEKEGPYYSVAVNGLSGKSEVSDFALKFASADESDFKNVMGSEIPGGSGN